jgi:toxin ParE1/3/4
MAAGPKPFALRPDARADLEDIWLFTAARWSQQQADKYIAGMNAAFERISENPNIARERSELRPPVRVYRYGAHVLIYVDAGDHIDIIRVRHGSEDWMNDPAGTSAE